MTDRQHSRGKRISPESIQFSARTLQAFGLLLILGSAVFWAFTGRESALFVGAGITLSTLGWLQRTISAAEERLPRYDPPPELEEASKSDTREPKSKRERSPGEVRRKP